jgi:hypothetical protein
MLHYEESVQRFGHLVKDSTETQEMTNTMMCMGPKGEVGDLQPAQLERILLLQNGLRKRCFVLLWELQLENQGVYLPSNGQIIVSDKVFHRNQAHLVLVNIKYLWAAVYRICIPGTRYYYVNNTIDVVMLNHFWLKPPEAEGNINDSTSPNDPSLG